MRTTTTTRRIVFQFADDAIVADPVFPIVAQSPVEAFTDQSRILEACDSLVKKLVPAGRQNRTQSSNSFGLRPCCRITSSSGIVRVRPARRSASRFSAI